MLRVVYQKSTQVRPPQVSHRGKGPLAGCEIVRVKILLEDGTHHSVDSSDLAFQICARDAFPDAFNRSR